MEREYVEQIADRDESFSQWYLDVVQRAELADYAPVRGSMVFRPYGYRIWELAQAELDRRFKETGVQNAYFPLFIPESIFRKETEHIAGFAPEVAWVTHAGQEELAERYLVRPTSETIIGTMYARWIQSYRDLPVLINQWCSVVRWERRTVPFLRTTEFLWQEGHTAHRNEADARERTMTMLEVYRSFLEDFLAIPVVPGKKTENEKFAGAVDTYSVEALMGNGRALQAGTSHYLGDGFARVLGIEFLDDDGERKPVHMTSWGLSWRVIGGLIMVHGDERGLVLPPSVAPYQVVIVPIAPERVRDRVLAEARRLAAGLGDVARVHLDDRPEHTPGWKFNEWELRGVPIRVELGPRDLEAGQAVLVRRSDGVRQAVPLDGVARAVERELADLQGALYRKAARFRDEMTREAATVDELDAILKEHRGFIYAGWCGDGACELAIKERTGATIRCLPLEGGEAAGACACCGRPARHRALFARAY
ncbi:MAG TPA: proline--tRNA ligase [Bacillota bacterium]